MLYSIRRTEDVELVRELHEQAFPADEWPGDDQEYWLARDARGVLVGFCSAKYFAETSCVVLTRAAVVAAARGKGLQRRMIRARVAWAKRVGAKVVVTYTSVTNHPSITNIIRAGFRLTGSSPHKQKDWHCFYLQLRAPKLEAEQLRPLLQAM